MVRDSWGTKVNNWKPSKIDTDNGGYIQPWDRDVNLARRLLGDNSTRDNILSMAIKNITRDKYEEIKKVEEEIDKGGVPHCDGIGRDKLIDCDVQNQGPNSKYNFQDLQDIHIKTLTLRDLCKNKNQCFADDTAGVPVKQLERKKREIREGSHH